MGCIIARILAKKDCRGGVSPPVLVNKQTQIRAGEPRPYEDGEFDMKKILPFKAIRYNQSKVHSMKDVVTPPYDVIGPELQNELYERSPLNFCRLDLPKEEGPARYETARELFGQWMQEGVLVSDTKPAIYVHHHHFILPDGRRMVRQGFLALRRLEDFSEGGVKPHEKTLDAPKADRLAITQATGCQLSPIFSLYSDTQGIVKDALTKIAKTTPVVDFVSHDNERHQLWLLTDEAICHKIGDEVSAKPLFIADGHHRYETALNYRKEVIKNQGEISEDHPANFIMMYFCSMQDPGMVILPIHRALHSMVNFDGEAVLEKLSGYFNIETYSVDDQQESLDALTAAGKKSHSFLLFIKGSAKCHVLSIDKTRWLETGVAGRVPESLTDLDVTVLHQLILGEILDLSDESQARQENITYIKSTDEALDEATGGKFDAVFILNPTKLAQMETVANAGEKMPQKSTFFYPKIVSGLVLYRV